MDVPHPVHPEFKKVNLLKVSEYQQPARQRELRRGGRASGLAWHVTSLPQTNEKRNA
jgi:hypothetical protein